MSPKAVRGAMGRNVRSDDMDSFDRPGKRTRPRTKDRPDYSELPIGRIITIDRGRYRVQLDEHMVVIFPTSISNTVTSVVATTLMSSGRPGSQAYTSANV